MTAPRADLAAKQVPARGLHSSRSNIEEENKMIFYIIGVIVVIALLLAWLT